MYVVSNDLIPVHKMDTTNNTMYRAVCCMNMYNVVYIGLLLIILLTYAFYTLYFWPINQSLINSSLFIVVPLPEVSVQAVGIPVTTESFTLVCTGSAPPNVLDIATVSARWQLNGAELTNSTLEGVSVIMNSGTMATLSFPILNASIHERDDYNCVATLSITSVPTTKTANETYRLLSLSKTDSVKLLHVIFLSQLIQLSL